MPDPVALTADLIRCRSVTPADDGALALLAAPLRAAGFDVRRADRGGIANLLAVWGQGGPTLGFNGHTDVVPAGDPAAWTHPPFGAEIAGGVLYGRGACDMKSAVAAFIAASVRFVTETPPAGRIVLAITGDEEGAGVDGTRALLAEMDRIGLKMDHCIVGEPTCPETMGEMIKIGRRGSLTARITAKGIQGHVAYPHRAKNPVPALVRLLDTLAARVLDTGTAHFDPSTLAITTVDVGNPASNVVPAEARASVNIRFNDAHSAETLRDWIDAEAARASAAFDVPMQIAFERPSESFVTQPGPFVDLVEAAITEVTGRIPVRSTSGGTSDARFIKDHCPVVEAGLVGASMHQSDEHVALAHIGQLTEIYAHILRAYFAAPPAR